MKCLEVLPNFMILAECNESYNKNVMGILRCFCEVQGYGEHIDTYKITPDSYWDGLNRLQGDADTNFIDTLKTYVSKDIPSNVLSELEYLDLKYGRVVLLGNDALMVKELDLLEEIKNSSSLDPFIVEVQGNILFFNNTSIDNLQKIFRHEFGCPIQYRVSAIQDFIIFDSYKRYAVKASTKHGALKALYGNHPFISEDDLRINMNKNTKANITDSDIDNYIQFILDFPREATCNWEIDCLPASKKPIIF